MSTTVIPPNSASGMYVDTGNQGYGYGYGDGYAHLFAAQHITDNNVSSAAFNSLNAIHTNSRLNGDAIASSSRDILQDSCHSTASIIASNERGAFAVQDNADKNSHSIHNSVERNGLSNLTATTEHGNRNLQAIERNAGENRLQGAINSGEIRDFILTASAANQVAHKDTILDLCKSTGSITKQASENKGQVSLELCEVKNDIQLQASRNVDAIQLEAFKNKELLSKQLADCCCELKERVSSSASATQQLIRETESNRVRDQLNAANTENLFLRMTGTSVPIP